jgi:hypothetical protein
MSISKVGQGAGHDARDGEWARKTSTPCGRRSTRPWTHQGRWSARRGGRPYGRPARQPGHGYSDVRRVHCNDHVGLDDSHDVGPDSGGGRGVGVFVRPAANGGAVVSGGPQSRGGDRNAHNRTPPPPGHPLTGRPRGCQRGGRARPDRREAPTPCVRARSDVGHQARQPSSGLFAACWGQVPGSFDRTARPGPPSTTR